MKAQKKTIKGVTYFVCQYTNAVIAARYFIPVGKYNRKERSFATLPVLLRAVFEEEGEKETVKYLDVKKTVETYFNQPDIPIQTKLDPEKKPLSEDELFDYLEEIDCGAAWLEVPQSHPCPQSASKKRKIKR